MPESNNTAPASGGVSEMVERVARIIDPKARWEIESPHDIIDQSIHRSGDRFAWVERRDAALEKARAVISAMREPNPEIFADVASTRDACCSVGFGGPYEIAAAGLELGTKHPWHIRWLPKGRGPTHDDYVICLVASPPNEDWRGSGLGRGERPLLIEVICWAIEAYMRGAGGEPLMQTVEH